MAKLLPDIYVNSITDIPVTLFIEKGIRGIAVDIDNTLTTDGSQYLDPDIVNWVRTVREIGIPICIVSNNHEKRVKPFAEQLEVAYLCEAGKPKRTSKALLLNILGCNNHETVMIGDQIFTDMIFAHRCNFLSILVEPIGEDKHRGAAIKRFFERPLKYLLRKRSV
jgi:HAD superfamily phosphatase (TIGR01668 family)